MVEQNCNVLAMCRTARRVLPNVTQNADPHHEKAGSLDQDVRMITFVPRYSGPILELSHDQEFLSRAPVVALADRLQEVVAGNDVCSSRLVRLSCLSTCLLVPASRRAHRLLRDFVMPRVHSTDSSLGRVKSDRRARL